MRWIRSLFANDTDNSMAKRIMPTLQNSLYPKWDSKAF